MIPDTLAKFGLHLLENKKKIQVLTGNLMPTDSLLFYRYLKKKYLRWEQNVPHATILAQPLLRDTVCDIHRGLLSSKCLRELIRSIILRNQR